MFNEIFLPYLPPVLYIYIYIYIYISLYHLPDSTQPNCPLMMHSEFIHIKKILITIIHTVLSLVLITVRDNHNLSTHPPTHTQVDAVAKASQGMAQALISLDTQNPLVT